MVIRAKIESNGEDSWLRNRSLLHNKLKVNTRVMKYKIKDVRVSAMPIVTARTVSGGQKHRDLL